MIENILLVLVVLILSAKISGALFEKIGLDSTLGELLTGIVFGASVLNLVPAESIKSFGIIGSVLILFLAGMKQENVEEIYQDKVAIKIGLTLLFVTGIAMTAFFYFVPPYFGVELNIFQSIILAIAFAIIDIGVPAKVLISKGLISLPVGKITLRSAIINIVSGLFLFTLVTVFISGNIREAGIKIAEILAFFVIIVVLLFTLSKLSKFVMRLHMEEAEFSLAIILILTLAYFTEVIGFSSVLGAFIAGVLVARMPFAETKSFSDKIKSLSFGLFVPLFFVWFGLEINLAEIFKYLALSLIIFFAYTTLRFVITYIFMRRYKLSMPCLISASMLSVDVESLVVLLVATQFGIFKDDIALTLFAPSVFLSTLAIVVLILIFSKTEMGHSGVNKPE